MKNKINQQIESQIFTGNPKYLNNYEYLQPDPYIQTLSDFSKNKFHPFRLYATMTQ